MTRLLMVCFFLGFATPALAQGSIDAEKVYLWSGGTSRWNASTGCGAPSGGTTSDIYIDYCAGGEIYTKRSGGWVLVVRPDLLNVFTVQQEVSAAEPLLYWNESDQGANLKRWRLTPDAGLFRLQTTNDAMSSASTMMYWDRSGNATLTATFNANTIQLTNPLGVAYGGTGNASWTVGGVVYASGAAALSNLTPVATGQVLTSTGLLSSPAWSGNPTLASVRSTNWVAQTTGWICDAGGNCEANNSLFSPALHVKTFSAEDTAVIDGSFMVTPNRAVLYEAFTVPALGGSTGNLRVEYKDGTTADVFTNGDTVLVRTFTRINGGLIVGDAIGTVSGRSNANANYQEWTFTRLSGANGGSLPTSAVIPAKDPVLDFYTGGSGYILIDAVSQSRPLSNLTSSGTTATATTAAAHGYLTGDVVVVNGAAQPPYNGSFTITVTSATTFTYTMSGATSTPATCSNQCVIAGGNGVNSPTLRVNTWATSPTLANTTTQLLLGQLRSITGSSEYGMLAGDFANKHYVRLSGSNAEIAGIKLSLFDGSTETIRLDPTVPSFALGSTLPSGYGTGTGIWMGKDSGTYKARFGNPSGDRLQWDGTNLKVVSSTVSIDTSGITVADDPGGSASSTHGYQFSSAVAGSIYGLYGWSASPDRTLQLVNTTTAAAATADVRILASSNTRSAFMSLSAAGSSVGGGDANVSIAANYLLVDGPSLAAGEIKVRDFLNSITTTVQPGYVGTSTAHNLVLLAGNGTIATVCTGGGMTIGNPTGGCKGVGTLNVSAGIYLNNVLYTSPSPDALADLEARIAALELLVAQKGGRP